MEGLQKIGRGLAAELLAGLHVRTGFVVFLHLAAGRGPIEQGDGVVRLQFDGVVIIPDCKVVLAHAEME